MIIDPSTLRIANALVSLVSGLFLLSYWRNCRDDWGTFGWGVTSCLAAIGLGLLALAAALPAVFPVFAGPLLLDICTIAFLASARIFNRGSAPTRLYAVAALAWIAAMLVLRAAGLGWVVPASGSAMAGSLNLMAAFEFWRARAEQLRGRWPMIFVLIARGLALLLFASDIYLARKAMRAPWSGDSGVALVNFVGLIFSAGGAISLVTMSKERSEAGFKAAALVDPLTGLANRRAFMDRAQRMLDHSLRDSSPFSLLAFDLDRFKSVNDRFGHPMGDQLLRVFADTVARATRPTDVAGRMGGEEFVIAMQNCSLEDATLAAQRIRARFQDDGRFVSGLSISGTVSVGVAVMPDHGDTLAVLIASADRALYRAKNSGRNRVVVASCVPGGLGSENVVRIA